MNLSSFSSWSRSMPTIEPSSATPIRRSPPSVLRNAAMVLRTAYVTPLSSLSIFLEVPAQRGFELEGFRLATLDQLFGIAVGAQVLVEEKVLDRLAEARSSVIRL